ncbi:MAG: aldo/keto reductase [Myxococcota bacterium]
MSSRQPPPVHTLGASDLKVPRVVLGTMAYGTGRSEAQQVETVRAALDAGLTALDTAPLYHFGHTETMLGEALRGRAATVLGKVGLRWDDDARGDVLLRTTVGGRPIVVRKDSRPQAVRADVESSLTRLRLEALDLCQVHHPDVHTPIEDTMGALLQLRAEGKIRHIGVSNFDAEQLARAQSALGDVPLCSHQLEFSLLHLPGRAGLEQAANAKVGTLVYSPLHRGALTGGRSKRGGIAVADPRARGTAFVHANAARIDATLEAVVRPVAARLNASIVQVVLAWVLHQPGVTAAIVGVSRPEQARDTARAATLALEPEEVTSIERGFAALQLDPTAEPRKRDRVERKARAVAGRLLRRLRR